MPEQTSFGTILKFGATTVGALVSVAGASFAMEFVDTTNHGNANRWRTKRPVLIDPGEVEFELQMTSAQYAALVAMFDPTAAATAWTITWPFSPTVICSFNGWLTAYEVQEAQPDNILIVKCKITITGIVSFAAGS